MLVRLQPPEPCYSTFVLFVIHRGRIVDIYTKGKFATLVVEVDYLRNVSSVGTGLCVRLVVTL